MCVRVCVCVCDKKGARYRISLLHERIYESTVVFIFLILASLLCKCSLIHLKMISWFFLNNYQLQLQLSIRQ